ncbi:hypothetical protein SAMN05444851_1015 [Aliiroseovarius sediminilitoris]|uniref:Sulfotransferase family protein n=1 Tax=Aliiroseovarius sediminilitoris TaxID=1173584 RepID=A0A1I0NQN8_9RHOB|nr:hypothetical protein [Aliiroseovarius sediminilitoris]SEW03769.1 hypothetical protein SAMN05444851_1015 [Aliiroseovarius sediminilitoris]
MISGRPHVIVHAGFHKTGTTSLQDFLSQNRAPLSPFFDYYGQRDFMNAGAAARLYAQRPFPHRLYLFRKAFRTFLASIPDHEVIILSRESFSGGMPGHRMLGGRMITSYLPAAQKLARTIVKELRLRFGPDVAITFLYTTRDREDWLRSVHGHLLRSIRLTDDFDTFRGRFSAGIGPVDEARRMAKTLSPIPVVTAALEDHTDDPNGLATAVLDLAQVPRAARVGLTPAPHTNRGQGAGLRKAFLALNRQGLSKSELKAQKERLLSPHRRTP